MTRALLTAAVLAAGCVPRAGEFPCERTTECVAAGVQGTCEPSGFCSFPDPTCGSGDRYGEAAPPDLAGECVGGGGGAIDARGEDVDGAPSGGIRVIGATSRAPLTSVDSFELTRPAAAGPRSLLLVAVYSYFDFSVVTPPEGWTRLGDRADVDAWFHAWWFYRFVDSVEPASYQFTVSTNADVAAGLVAFENVDPARPFDATDDRLVTGSPFAAPSLDVETADATLVVSFVVDEAYDDSFNAPAGMVEEVDVGAVGMFVERLAAPGQTGERVSVTDADVPHTAGVSAVALRPTL